MISPWRRIRAGAACRLTTFSWKDLSEYGHACRVVDRRTSIEARLGSGIYDTGADLRASTAAGPVRRRHRLPRCVTLGAFSELCIRVASGYDGRAKYAFHRSRSKGINDETIGQPSERPKNDFGPCFSAPDPDPLPGVPGRGSCSGPTPHPDPLPGVPGRGSCFSAAPNKIGRRGTRAVTAGVQNGAQGIDNEGAMESFLFGAVH